MKKKDTVALASGKTETNYLELPINHTPNQKTYRDHKTGDYHLHGRVNKFPFGAWQGPHCF